jgi:PAS domain S-box-containing protein
LTAGGLDVDLAARQGRFVELDAQEVLSRIVVDNMPDAERFEEIVGGVLEQTRSALKGSKAALDGQSAQIAVFGEMVALLWTEGKFEAAIKLEQLWNQLSTKHDFSLRCAYPEVGFQGAEKVRPFHDVCAQHSGTLFIPKNMPALASARTGPDSEETLLRSEERFRWLVEAVEDYAIFMMDSRGIITSWNKGAERIKGWQAHEIIGKHYSVFYPPEEIDGGRPDRQLVIAAQENHFEDEGWRVRKDGSRFWASVVISPIRDNSGKVIGFGKVTRDFTHRITSNEQLRKEIAERTEAQRKLMESERSLRELSLRLLQTQEIERRRIGRDLHDSVGQYLVGLKMKLDALKSSARITERRDTTQLAECSQLAEEAIKEVRTISYLLYPPMLEELGLKSAIPWYVEGFTSRSGIKTTFEVSPGFDRVPEDVELALFRVLQEALTNVHRHSDSATAKVQLLKEEGAVVLKIVDEGKGIHPKNGDSTSHTMRAFGVGLRGMSERLHQLSGSLELNSTAGGTTVVARVPLPQTRRTN